MSAANNHGKPFSLNHDLYIMYHLRKGRSTTAAVANKLRRSERSVEVRKSVLKQMREEARFKNEYKSIGKVVRKLIWDYRAADLTADQIAKILKLDTVTVYAVMAEPLEWA